MLLAFTSIATKADTISNGAVAPPSDDPPYIVNSGWTQFSWTGGPNVWNVEGAYTFSLSGSGTLEVTDWRYDGDQFKVYDFGSLIGTTSTPTDDSFTIGDNPDAAFVDPRFSHGTWILGAGPHSLTFYTIASAFCFPDGSGNFRVDASITNPPAVPLPSSVYGGGALLLAMFIARKRMFVTV